MPVPPWLSFSGVAIAAERKQRRKKLISLAPLALLALAASSAAEENLAAALTSGTPDLFLRYRFERVDDAVPKLKNAYASTLRTALGYQTGAYHAFSGYLQVENVSVIGPERYNNGGENGITDRATVVDPQGTEINQAYLRYGGLRKDIIILGRQEITHREAPLHRFVGNALFRQNWQSFDAFRVLDLSFPHTTIDYAYVWNVNRIFGEHNPLPDASDFPMRSHFINAQYSGLPLAKIEAYGYLLDFNSAVSQRLSTATFGLRMQGDYMLAQKTKLLFAAESANQSDYGRNPGSVNVNYYAAELGVSHPVGGSVEAASLKLNYELLGSRGGIQAFQTPLGTNHAFQGAADRFLTTPRDGIQDIFATLGVKAFGAQWSLARHRFRSDHDRYTYGDEWDFSVERPIAGKFLIGFQYAAYRASRNALNVARNTATQQAFDLTKAWAYVQYKY
jgi:hypothetical protein